MLAEGPLSWNAERIVSVDDWRDELEGKSAADVTELARLVFGAGPDRLFEKLTTRRKENIGFGAVNHLKKARKAAEDRAKPIAEGAAAWSPETLPTVTDWAACLEACSSKRLDELIKVLYRGKRAITKISTDGRCELATAAVEALAQQLGENEPHGGTRLLGAPVEVQSRCSAASPIPPESSSHLLEAVAEQARTIAQLTSKHAEICSKNAEMGAQLCQLAEAQAPLRKQADKVPGLEKDKKTQAAEIERLRKRIQELEATNTSLNKQAVVAKDMEKRVAAVRADDARLRQELDSVKAKCGNVEQQVVDLKRRLAMTDADNAALKRRVAELEAPPAVDPKALIAELEGEVCRAAEALCAQHVQLQPQRRVGFFRPFISAAPGCQRRFAPSPLLRASNGTKQFIETLLNNGIGSMLIASSGKLDLGKFELRFHGTTVDSACNLLVDGFDPSKRRRGQYGPGEYVGDYDTALDYESEKGDSGALLVVLLFTAAPGIVTHVPGHQIVVVNNPTDRSATYCVALGTFCDESKTADLLARLSAPFRGAPIANVTNSASTVVPRAVRFRDDAGKWAPADPAVGHAVAAAQALGATTCKCVVGQFSYTIDLAAKTQTNDHTGKVRALRIA